MENSKDHKAAAEPPLDCRVGLDIACYRINYCLSDWEDISAGMGELCAPIGAVRAVNALCDEVERLRSLLADIKAWDVEQFMTLPHDLRARIQAELVPNG